VAIQLLDHRLNAPFERLCVVHVDLVVVEFADKLHHLSQSFHGNASHFAQDIIFVDLLADRLNEGI